jgi:5-formyltetrahydrofolate cyclo-ligase
MKKDIRKLVQQRRHRMSASEVTQKSMFIKDRLFGLAAFKKAGTLLFYISYGNEVRTHEMIQECLRTGKKVAVPCTDAKNRQLSLSELRQWEDLGVGAYNIKEPRIECRCELSLDAVDLVIVPGVAFDCAGHRIGHGMGYYDRLLSQNVHALKVALAFELQVVDTIPTEHHDVTVDMIITEERTVSIKKQ